jgi:hypothetical protein
MRGRTRPAACRRAPDRQAVDDDAVDGEGGHNHRHEDGEPCEQIPASECPWAEVSPQFLQLRDSCSGSGRPFVSGPNQMMTTPTTQVADSTEPAIAELPSNAIISGGGLQAADRGPSRSASAGPTARRLARVTSSPLSNTSVQGPAWPELNEIAMAARRSGCPPPPGPPHRARVACSGVHATPEVDSQP